MSPQHHPPGAGWDEEHCPPPQVEAPALPAGSPVRWGARGLSAEQLGVLSGPLGTGGMHRHGF